MNNKEIRFVCILAISSFTPSSTPSNAIFTCVIGPIGLPSRSIKLEISWQLQSSILSSPINAEKNWLHFLWIISIRILWPRMNPTFCHTNLPASILISLPVCFAPAYNCWRIKHFTRWETHPPQSTPDSSILWTSPRNSTASIVNTHLLQACLNWRTVYISYECLHDTPPPSDKHHPTNFLPLIQ